MESLVLNVVLGVVINDGEAATPCFHGVANFDLSDPRGRLRIPKCFGPVETGDSNADPVLGTRSGVTDEATTTAAFGSIGFGVG